MEPTFIVNKRHPDVDKLKHLSCWPYRTFERFTMFFMSEHNGVGLDMVILMYMLLGATSLISLFGGKFWNPAAQVLTTAVCNMHCWVFEPNYTVRKSMYKQTWKSQTNQGVYVCLFSKSCIVNYDWWISPLYQLSDDIHYKPWAYM